MKDLIKQIYGPDTVHREEASTTVKNLLTRSGQQGGGTTPPPDPNPEPNPNPEPPATPPSGGDDLPTVDNITDDQITALKAKEGRSEAEEKLLDEIVTKEQKTIYEDLKDKDYDSLSDDDKAIVDKFKEEVKPTDEEQTTLDATKDKEWEDLTEDEQALVEKFDPERVPQSSFIEDMAEVFGVEIEDTDGITDDQDGLIKLTQKAGQLFAQQSFEQLFNANDELKKFYDHVMVNGGTISSLVLKESAPDHTKFDIAQEDGQRGLIEWSLKQKGLSDDIIEATVESIVSKGELEKVAKSTQQSEQSAHEAKIKAIEDQEKAELAAENARIAEENTKINSVIDSGKLMGIEIPATERQKFKDFIFSDAIGEASQKLDITEKLFFNYIMFKEFKVKGIESKRGNERTLTDRFKSNQRRDTPKVDNPKTPSEAPKDTSLKDSINSKGLKQLLQK